MNIADEFKNVISTLSQEIEKLQKIRKQAGITPPHKRLLTINEAAKYLGIGKTEAYNHLRKHVRAINHGKKILIPKEELDALIERAKRTGYLFS